MAFTLKIKSSSVAGKVPDANALAVAELGLNLIDQKLYSKDANGTVFEIGQAGDTPSGTNPPLDGNQLGDLFFDTFENTLLYWNGVEWVPVGQEAIAIGDLTDVDTSGVADGMVLAYNGGSWEPVSPASLSVDVDLDYTPNGDNAGTVTNTAGDDATIPIATDTVAGLFTGAEKQKLAAIDEGAKNFDAGRALTFDAISDPDTLNADIATETDLGVVSVGSGLEVTAAGELSVTPVDVPPGTVVSETAPADPAEGQLWWADTDVNEGGGRLYVWTGDEWVDTSLPGGSGSDFGKTQADQLYLSKVDDDTAAGDITFQGTTTHDGDVIAHVIKSNVNGIGGSISVHDETVPTGVTIHANDVARNPVNEGVRALLVNSTINENLDTDVHVIQANLNGVPTNTNHVNVFQASFPVHQNTSGDVHVLSTGVQKSHNTGSGSVYFLNSKGDAPSYHSGTFKVGNVDIKSTNATLGQNNTVVGIQLFGSDGENTAKAGQASFNSNQASTLQISNNKSGSSSRLINFWLGGSSVVCGKFYANDASNMTLDVGNGGSLINTSDYRAKSNVNELGSSVDVIKALRPVAFNYTEDQSKTYTGFIAHELQEHVPVAVVGEKDAVDEEGNPEYQGVDVTKLIPILTKALQEGMQKNEDLVTRVEALEGGGATKTTTRKRKS